MFSLLLQIIIDNQLYNNYNKKYQKGDNMSKKKYVIYITVIIIILLLYISIKTFFSYNYKLEIDNEYIDNNTQETIKNDIDYQEIINNLKEYYNNNDVKGILEINNTDYIVPIMQSEDNDYYLNHTPDNKKHYMGSIYLDFRVDIDSSKKLLIYGHNSSKIDMPFKILEKYYDENYYKEHKYIEITTSNEKKKYEIFSVYVETTDFDYMNIVFDNDDEYLKHIIKLKDKSMYDTKIELYPSDEILILQTCSTHKDYSNYPKKYLLIVLKRI